MESRYRANSSLPLYVAERDLISGHPESTALGPAFWEKSSQHLPMGLFAWPTGHSHSNPIQNPE